MTVNFSALTDAPRIDAILNSHSINGFEAGGGTDKQTTHSYGPVYEALLAPLADKKCVLLEIGVNAGGSLLLWHDLCKQSLVIGVDCNNVVHPGVFERMDGDRYHFLIGDGYSRSTIDMVQTLASEGLDFALDDGPHTLESQCAFIHSYVPLLNDGGIAVIEDVQDFKWFDTLTQCVPNNYSYDIVDRRAIKGRYDDLMLIIKRASNG